MGAPMSMQSGRWCFSRARIQPSGILRGHSGDVVGCAPRALLPGSSFGAGRNSAAPSRRCSGPKKAVI